MVIDVDVYVLDNKLKETIDYVQGTNALGISFHFLDYDIPSGATAKVYAAKPSTKAVYNTAAISGNDVNVDVTDQMFSEVGLTKLQVQIVKGDDTLVTFVQPVRVQKNYVAGDVPESENESNFIDDYLEEIKVATNNANTATDKANTAAGRAEDALEAIEGAVEGTLINDETPSKVTVYSGDKVEHLANLLDIQTAEFIRSSGTVDGNKITIISDSQKGIHYAAIVKNIKQNTRYTIAWNSSRTGEYGGGVQVQALNSLSGQSSKFLGGKISELNGSLTFETEDYTQVRIYLMAGTENSAQGDTTTFEALMVEGVYGFDNTPPVLNSVMDVTKLLLDERTNAANLFNFDDLVLSRASIKIDGSKLTITSTNVSGSQRVAKDFKNILKSNTYYTISIKSTRTGNYGGGFLVEREENGQYISVLNKSNVLNSFGTFNTGDLGTCTAFRIYLYSGYNVSSIGDTATFEVMLIEGTQYAPANLHNVKDLAQLTATVDNRTAINLFGDLSMQKYLADITYIDNGFKITTTGNTATPNVRKDFRNLKPNTNYVVVAKSQRSGAHGGGIHVGGVDNNVFTSLCDVTNDINPVAKFNAGEHEFIRIAFYSGLKGDPIGDTATFTDIMLVEGDFAPGGYVPSIGADNFSQAVYDTKEQIKSLIFYTSFDQLSDNANIVKTYDVIERMAINSILQAPVTADALSDIPGAGLLEIKNIDDSLDARIYNSSGNDYKAFIDQTQGDVAWEKTGGDQKVLWEGGWHMVASHTAKLSEKISDQKNGIVLVFSHWNADTGKSDDYGFSYFFVPKESINLLAGLGHSFMMYSGTSAFSVAFKYLYISDDKITGHSNNNETGTATGSGIKYENNATTLKYVIGV